jgi:hypothetical protein
LASLDHLQRALQRRDRVAEHFEVDREHRPLLDRMMPPLVLLVF